jgi:hypothetical protein
MTSSPQIIKVILFLLNTLDRVYLSMVYGLSLPYLHTNCKSLDVLTQIALYSPHSGCSADGSAPRLGRGGQRFKSAHPDLWSKVVIRES